MGHPLLSTCQFLRRFEAGTTSLWHAQRCTISHPQFSRHMLAISVKLVNECRAMTYSGTALKGRQLKIGYAQEKKQQRIA